MAARIQTAVEGIGLDLTPTPVVRAAIYCRLSKAGGRSVDRQEDDGRRIAADKGWQVADDHVFREVRSASPYAKRGREQWDALLVAVQTRQVDAVILWMEDRSTRDIIQAGVFVQTCREAGLTRLVLPSFDYDLTDQDSVLRFFGEVLAGQREANQTSKRTRRAKAEEAEDGRRPTGGKRAFGEQGRRRIQDNDGGSRVVAIVPADQAEFEAKLICAAIRRILAGDSLRGICLDWNDAGYLPVGGGRWTTRSLKRMLISPRIAGLREHRGTLHPGDFPAIVDQEEWEAARAILTDPTRATTTIGGVARHLLTGLIVCGICKTKLRVARRNDNRTLVFKCGSRSDGGNGCVVRKVDDVDALVLEALFRAVEQGPTWNEAAAERPADDPTRPHYEALARLTAELDMLDAMIAEAELAERLGGKPSPSAATLRRKMGERETERDRHYQAVNQLQHNRVVGQVPRNLRDIWDDLSLDRQRAIVAAMIERIEVYPQGSGKSFDPDLIKVIRRG